MSPQSISLWCGAVVAAAQALHVWSASAQAPADPCSHPEQWAAPDPVPSIEHNVPPTEYDRVVDRAAAEYSAQRWAEARALFQRAHALRPSAITWRALAMTALALRRYVDALREFTAALQDQRDALDAALRAEASDHLVYTNQHVGCYRVHVEPSEARLYVGEAEAKLEPNGALLLSVGSHGLRAAADGYEMEQRTLLVTGQDDEELSFRLQKPEPVAVHPPPLPPLRPWFDRVFRDYRATWSSGAAAAAFGGSSFALYLAAKHEDERVQEKCSDICVPGAGDFDKRDRLTAWSYATVVLSGALTVTTAILFFRDRGRAHRSTSDKQKAALLRNPLLLQF